ncbi:MAG: hypothetical protein H7X74_03160 [Methyloceanibacter sp.]|nr:hypothetical protein [Methyloceanibacter sp.]
MHHILIVSLVALSAAFTSALAAASLEGSWRGSGIVSHRGTADAVRCRVSFSRVTAKSFGVSAQCATDTGRYDVSGRVVGSGANRYFGLLQGQGVSGQVVIVQHGNRLSVTVTNRRGSAKFSLSRG